MSSLLAVRMMQQRGDFDRIDRYLRKPWFTQDIKFVNNCDCTNNICRIWFTNPVFGNNCLIKEIECKKDNEVIRILQQLDELNEIKTEIDCLQHICDMIRDPKNKNMLRMSINYCNTCKIIYDSIHEIEYKWCKMTYKKKIVRIRNTDN